jgi:uncharacterized membrane protein
MSSEPTKVDAETAAVEPNGGPKAKLALKDRIADLQLKQRASAVGGRFADGMKAVQAVAPMAAGKVKAAASAVRMDKLNRETLKAGRDGIAAKVEAMLKPRPVDDAVPPSAASAAEVRAPSATSAPEEPKTSGRRDITALKARLDDALKAKTQSPDASDASAVARSEPPVTPAHVAQDAAPKIAAPDISSRVKTGFSRLVSRRSTADTAPETAVVPVGPDGGAVAISDIATQRPVTTRTSRTTRASYADSEARRPIFSLGLILTALTAGGVLHILTTFGIPTINTGSAYERLKWQLEPNTIRVMPVDANGETPLPFLTADMRYAMCRYDITQTSVQISATLPDVGWSLALYTPQGDNFYAVPGQDGRVVTAAFTINSASDRLLLPVPGVRRTDTDAAQVTSPQREGLLVIRAPNKGPAYLPAVEAALKGATCRAVTRR